jgi:hypothetical protein
VILIVLKTTSIKTAPFWSAALYTLTPDVSEKLTASTIEVFTLTLEVIKFL